MRRSPLSGSRLPHHNPSTILRPRRSTARLYAACESLERRTLLSGGVLGAAVNYPVPALPESAAVGDVNGDGILDLVTANDNGTISVFFGKGNGKLKPAATMSDGLGNSVSRAELAIARINSNSSGIFVVNGSIHASEITANSDGSFGPAQLMTLAGNATAVATGDFNLDGSPDVVFGYDNGTVTTFLGTATGVTVGSSESAADDPVSKIVVTDVNSDGIPDLLVGDAAGNVIYLQGYGDGSFAPPITVYSVGSNQSGFVVGDFNGDGNVDLGVGTTTGNVQFLLGNGEGGFTPSQSLALPPGLNGAAAADLNGDGKLDVVISNEVTSQLDLLIGNGDGTFSNVPATYSVGNTPTFTIIADLSGDGRPDVIVGYAGPFPMSGPPGGPYGVSVLPNLSPAPQGGILRPPTTVATANKPEAVAIADLNGDGIPDMVVADKDSNEIQIFLGQGDGKFGAPKTYTGFCTPESIAIGDLFGNGDADIVVGNSGDGSVTVLIGNGDGGFETLGVYGLDTDGPSYGKVSVAIGDIADDGEPDILATDANTPLLNVIVNNGDDSDFTYSAYDVGLYPAGVTVGDINGDGIPDVIVPNEESDSVSVFVSNGMGLASEGQFPAGPGPVAVGIGRFSDGSFADLAVADNGGYSNYSTGNASVALLRGNGTGGFYAPQITAIPGNRAGAIAVGDINGDGTPDIIVTSGYQGSATDLVNVLSGNGDGTFKHAISYTIANAPTSVVLTDINQDGKPDVIVTNEDHNTVSILVNSVQGLFFRPGPPLTLANHPSVVAAGQFQGNGPGSLVVGEYSGVQILLGNGDGSYKDGQFFPTQYGVTDVVTADVNGDNNQDVIFSYEGDEFTKIGVLLGNGQGGFSQPVFTTIPYDIAYGPQAIAEGVIIPGDTADLAIATGRGESVDILRANSDGTFEGPTSYGVANMAGTDSATYYYADAVALGKFGGDGPADIAVASSNSDSVFVFLSNSDGTLGTPEQYAAGADPISIAVGDLNNDTHDDIVVANGLPFETDSLAGPRGGPVDTISVLFGNGGGTFSTPNSIPITGEPTLVTIGDFNGDGKLDLAVDIPGNSSVPMNSVDVLVGIGDGTFKRPVTLATGNYPHDVIIADVNGDGNPDIVVANQDDYSIGVYLNDGLPRVTMGTGGMVQVTGGGGDESDSIGYSNGMITINLGGTPETFTPGNAQHIMLHLGDGEDSLMIGSGAPPISVQGGTGQDSLMTLGSDDTLLAGNGNAFLMAGNGTHGNSLAGASGNDTVIGGGSGSSLFGGSGSDVLEPGSAGEFVRGGQGSDTITGATDGGDSLNGGVGDDILLDGGGDGDMINGGAGLNFAQYNSSDTMSGIYELIDPPKPSGLSSSNPQTAVAADGHASTASVQIGSTLKVFASDNGDSVDISLSGSDLIVTINSVALDTVPESEVSGIKLTGGDGNDTLTVDSGVDVPATLHGGAGNDSLTGGGGGNVVMGEGGNDTLVGGGGTNLLIPGQRDNYANEPGGSDSLLGGSGYTIADFSERTDPMFLSNDGTNDSGDSSEGEHTTIATNVNAIYGGTGNDTIIATTAGMFVSGGAGNDSITGQQESDLIAGGSGKNKVVVDAEPVVLDLRNNQKDQYQGITDASIDILTLDSGLDSLVTDLTV